MIKDLKGILFREKGFALVLALLVLVILTILGISALMTSTTDIKIAGNVKTATKSLYIAEGGIEAISVELQNSAINKFTTTSTFDNIQEHTIDAIPTATLTNPINWVGTGNDWYIDSDLTTPLSSTNTSWPIYKTVTVGDQDALITLSRPNWFSSIPTKINFPQVISQAVAPSPRSVTTDLEIEFGNNLLFFQTFTQSDGSTYITSSDFDNGVVYIGNSGYDKGIDISAGMITGVCTNDNQNKALIVYRYNPSYSSNWEIVGEPDINSTAKIFALGGGKGRLYTPFGGGNGEEPVVTKVGAEYIPTDTGFLSLSSGEKYKVVLKDITDLSLSANNPPGETDPNRKWTSYNHNQF
jgi:Tfp pilus assembly protein PilX